MSASDDESLLILEESDRPIGPARPLRHKAEAADPMAASQASSTATVCASAEARPPSPPPEAARAREPWHAQLAEGDLIKALDVREMWCEALVIGCRGEGRAKEVKVHYRGWKRRWDEWIPLRSGRLRPCSFEPPTIRVKGTGRASLEVRRGKATKRKLSANL